MARLATDGRRWELALPQMALLRNVYWDDAWSAW
jgi:hypothetical protein